MCLDASLRGYLRSEYSQQSFLYHTPKCSHDHHDHYFIYKDYTPFTWALEHGYWDCVKILICAGVDVNEKGFKRTALEIAVQNEHLECIDLLIRAGADVNGCKALLLAAKTGNDNCVALLTNAGAYVNAQNQYGSTALKVAVSPNNFQYRNSNRGIYYKIAKHLIQAGADVNIADNTGFTALHGVCIIGRNVLENTELLLAAGADVNIKTAGGDNVISTYCKESYSHRAEKLTVLKLLLSAGGNISDVARDIRDDINLDTGICLMSICKERIRTYLLDIHDSNLFVNVPQLGLPTLMVNFLLDNISLAETDEKSSHICRCNSQ